MIELSQVSCRVGGRWVLQDVSLRVPEGEVFGLAGANGAGKSLLLAVCATLIRPAGGTVFIAGRDARAEARAVRRLIGYLPEEVGWNPQMTVREDLAFFAGAHGLARDAGRAAAGEALERWGLAPVAGAPVGDLGRGLRRRLGLARALLHGPRVLLLDDPAAGLDADAREILWRELRRHAAGGGSAIMASHRADELAAACSRVGVLAGGFLKDVREARGAGGEGAHAVPPRSDAPGGER